MERDSIQERAGRTSLVVVVLALLVALGGCASDDDDTDTATGDSGDSGESATPGEGDTDGAAGGGGSSDPGTATGDDNDTPSEVPGDGDNPDVTLPEDDLGEGDGSDVVTIGDSYMNLVLAGIELSLERISGRDYRNYGVGGTRILDGAIPNQYQAAVDDNPSISTVIMTGGGNDIIQDEDVLSSCQDFNDDCIAAVDEIAAAIEDLIVQMSEDGVQDVVFVGYGRTTSWDLGETLDYNRELLAERCVREGSPYGVRCHFVDPTEELDGNISFDGIHPTPQGYDILGQMVWDRMQAEGVRR